MRELAMFAGAGGGILGSMLLGHQIVGVNEIEEYPCEVLRQRQIDGALPGFPIWNMDIREFNERVAPSYAGMVDIISGGFPCQDISCAGKGAGIEGERSGLWKELAETIRITRPRFAFLENSPMLTVRGLGTVLRDLAEMGYDAEWCCLGASDVGAPHQRKRAWILAYSNSVKRGSGVMEQNTRSDRRYDVRRGGKVGATWWDEDPADTPDTDCQGLEIREGENATREGEDGRPVPCRGERWATKPAMGRVAHGVASNVDKHREIDYTVNYEREQLSKAGPEKNEGYQRMSDLWRSEKQTPSSPQGQRQDEQQNRESDKNLPEVSQGYSCEGWGLGAWRNAIERGEVQDLREIIYSDTLSRNQKEFLVWLGSMQGGERAAECFEALGESPRVATGVKNRVDRLKAIGNGQCPQCMAQAFRLLMGRLP